jgi:hypothetical protein
MHKRIRYKIGQEIMAHSLTGVKIKGIYRGKNTQVGALVYGSPVNSTDPPKLWKCASLSLEPVIKPKSYETRGAKPVLKLGDPCESYTKNQVKIIGFFIQYDAKMAWVRGWPEGRSRFEAPEAYHVLRESLRRC